jgi:hypothetical protein
VVWALLAGCAAAGGAVDDARGWREDLRARDPARRLSALRRIEAFPAQGLEVFGKAGLPRAIWQRVRSDPADRVRARAAALLGQPAVLADLELRPLLDRLLREECALVERPLVAALGRRLPVTERGRLWELAEGPGPDRLRYRLLEALGFRAPAADVERLGTLAADDAQSQALRWGAVRGLTHAARPESVPALVQALATGTPMVRAAAHEGLVTLTGRDAGQEARDWWRLWETEGDGLLRKIAVPPPVTDVPERLTGTFRFFGVELPVQPMVIAMDCSGSMNLTWNRVIEEFEQAVAELPPACRFDVVAFNHELHHWRRYLVPAGPTALANLLEHVSKEVDPSGHTNVHDTLAYILQRAHPGQPYARTLQVILVSDGEPNRGQYTEPEDILRSIRKLRPHDVVIHTLALQRRGLDLLRGLADDSGGTFTLVAEDR